MNKFIKLVVTLSIFIFTLCISACALETITVDSNNMNIVVDGERVYADNFVYQGTTYVPLRRIAEMLGKKVDWNAEIYGAFITDGGEVILSEDTTAGLETQKAINIDVEKNTMKLFVNDNQVEADNFVYRNTTYVPLRKISEMLEKDVIWEQFSNTASIGKKSISIFDGKVLGTINGIEFTDYMYNYYSYRYDDEYEYYEYIGEDPLKELGSSKDEYVISQLKIDYALLNYAKENGLSMSPFANSRYYDSVTSTLKGVKGDEEKFLRMLQMQGFDTLNSYYYAMLISDLFMQYVPPFEETVSIQDVEEVYQNNQDININYTFAEIESGIRFDIAKDRASKKLEELSKDAVVVRY